MTPPADTFWLTIQEATHFAKVSRRTLYNWMRDGKIRAVRTAGGGVRIDPASLFQPETGAARPIAAVQPAEAQR